MSEDLTSWLLERACPVWWRPGADQEAGGFHDRLGADGRPLPGAKRARVQARQVFSYRQAGALGWPGPWREAMTHGLAFLEQAHRRPDGLYAAIGGEPEGPVDLYDQAFLLLALASADDAAVAAGALEARGLLARLPREAAGGFASLGGGPLDANPNMHLFEAFLAWMAVDPEGPWRAAAAGQARLAVTRLIDVETGALSELFGPGWTAPDPTARAVWPGHQFEWAWLLMRWSALAGDAAALIAALRLMEIGERAGVDPDRGVTVNALDGRLDPTDHGTRLWPQTERLRAALLAGAVTGDTAFWDVALSAAANLKRFLDVPTPGLWRDSLESDDLTAPASSLYHIVGAVAQLAHVAAGRR
jgi:mannose-6-phosphate isomerase